VSGCGAFSVLFFGQRWRRYRVVTLRAP
jgi:hypothetical protein